MGYNDLSSAQKNLYFKNTPSESYLKAVGAVQSAKPGTVIAGNISSPAYKDTAALKAIVTGKATTLAQVQAIQAKNTKAGPSPSVKVPSPYEFLNPLAGLPSISLPNIKLPSLGIGGNMDIGQSLTGLINAIPGGNIVSGLASGLLGGKKKRHRHGAAYWRNRYEAMYWKRKYYNEAYGHKVGK